MLHVSHGDFRQPMEEVSEAPAAGGRSEAQRSLIQGKAVPRPHVGIRQPFCDAPDGLRRARSCIRANSGRTH